MNALEAEFGEDEVIFLGVGVDDPLALEDFVSDTGFTAPILVDDQFGQPVCYHTPDQGRLYDHYFNRVGTDAPHGPFPLQVVIDGDYRMAYSSNSHQPEQVVEVVRGLLTGNRP